MKALFIGRFQPFHNGHLSVIKKILNECNFLTIAIGSSQESNTVKNPFTAEQRKEIISNVLESNGLRKNVKIIFLPDADCHENWVKEVKKIKFDIIYTGNKTLLSFFPDARIMIHEIDINSTQIRQLIKQNKEYKHLVPKEVYEFIQNLK